MTERWFLPYFPDPASDKTVQKPTERSWCLWCKMHSNFRQHQQSNRELAKGWSEKEICHPESCQDLEATGQRSDIAGLLRLLCYNYCMGEKESGAVFEKCVHNFKSVNEFPWNSVSVSFRVFWTYCWVVWVSKLFTKLFWLIPWMALWIKLYPIGLIGKL